MSLRDNLIIWLQRKSNQLELEKDNLKYQRRYEIMDSLDLYEMMRAEIRIDAWNEFITDLLNIILHCNR